MSSFDLNQASSIEEEEHDLCVPNHLFAALYHRSSDYSCITFDHHQQHEHKEILFMDGSSCNDDRGSIAPDPANESHRNDLKLSLGDPVGSLKREEEEEEEASGVREDNSWVPSKMRFMRKMMKYSAHMIVSKPSDSQEAIRPVRGFPIQTTTPPPAHKNSNNNNNTDSSSTSPSGIIRVCSDCNTTKTPLWRSGPRGPKSLCNACGIRQRKARRAMAAALHGGVGLPGGGGGHGATAVMANKTRKETKLGIDRTDLPFKKRCKMAITASPCPPPPPPAPSKKLCFDDATLMASNKHNNSTVIKKVFPQEERDAAVLLMALSCGIIRS